MAQSGKRLTLGFGSDHDLTSPTLGSALTVWSLFGLSLSLSLCSSLTCALSLFQKKKKAQLVNLVFQKEHFKDGFTIKSNEYIVLSFPPNLIINERIQVKMYLSNVQCCLFFCR